MNPALAKKLQKLLDTDVDQPDLVTSLRELSDFYGPENSLVTRRNLRGDLEKRSLGCNRDFLDAYRRVQQELNAVERDLHELKSSCSFAPLCPPNPFFHTPPPNRLACASFFCFVSL